MSRELQFLIYNTPAENARVDVVVKDETLWATQKAMATLFGVQTPAINKHLKNIFAEGELDAEVVISSFNGTAVINHGWGRLPQVTLFPMFWRRFASALVYPLSGQSYKLNHIHSTAS